jgi:hypothetical protein
MIEVAAEAAQGSSIITAAVLEWAERVAPGARVIGCEVRPLAGGAVARWVDQVTLHLSGGHDQLELVRKDAPPSRSPDIDWGSCRVGPAALDLANMVAASSGDVARYARTWQQHAGQPLPGDTIELGYQWAALQIPVQYLPWTAGHRPTPDVEATLDQIENALRELEG